MRIWRFMIFRLSIFFEQISTRELDMQLICRFGLLIMMRLHEIGYFGSLYLLLRIA